MRKHLFQYFFRLEYLIASLAVLAAVQLMLVISDNLPEADETSFLNPILDRIDFLNIEDVSLDAIFAVKDAEFPHPRIKVINVGEVAPVPDGMIALLLRKLHALGASVVGVDAIFDRLHFERFPPERQDEAEALIEALHELPNVVVVNGFDHRTMQSAFELDPRVRASQAQYGFANLVPDDDGVVRRFLPRTRVDGEEWLSLPVRLLSIAAPDAVEDLLRLPPEPQIIYYTGTYFQFESVPIEDVVFGSMYDGDFFRNAIVLVGFVNEGGLFYLGDTHKTPMGKKIGVEGPDMPGVLIHANIVNMLLQGDFITPVPAWGDWLLVFLLSYASIAVYRVLRTKPNSRFGVGMLITTMLFTEAVMVFFFPLIAFFYFDVKISYHLMATAVLLFIPANALTTKVQFFLLHRRVVRQFGREAHPVTRALRHAFEDDQPFPARLRLQHSGIVLVQYAWAQRVAEARAEGRDIRPEDFLPDVESWKRWLPEAAAICGDESRRSAALRYTLRFLSGRKDEQLRDSRMREMYLATELPGYNEFDSFEEWELMLPHVLHLWRKTFRDVMEHPLFVRDSDGGIQRLSISGATEPAKGREIPGEQNPGLYSTFSRPSHEIVRLSPFCEWTECKLHRTPEFFVFAGLLRKQHGTSLLPAYLGPTPNCEPALSVRAMMELRELELHILETEQEDRKHDGQGRMHEGQTGMNEAQIRINEEPAARNEPLPGIKERNV
ncbi:MAG: CHASE2 domain-containing protein [Bacteroidetes bacterium]|nr:CHASE2 domain-containing protein [Bacteroidota bacterium]